ncbi:AMP-binding protein [Nocardia jejuensis]|uniref:AMP-binding protein n=1 Tax=Nocardia jejuensis TaxID=328049 RepID=UPI0012FA7333|nr:AMP-binding protein [Nocardia jejuensis]
MPENLSTVERSRLADEWADGVELYDLPSVASLIESGRRVPSVRTAIRCGGHILTYAELYARLDGARIGTAGPTLDDLARLLSDIAAAAQTGALLAELGPAGTGLTPGAVAAAADDRRAVAADLRSPCRVDRAYGSPDVRLLATHWDTTDASVELLAALADGATLVLSTAAQRGDIATLADLIATSAATHVVATADTLAAFADLSAQPELPTVRRWDVLGTGCPAVLPGLLRELAPGSCAGFAFTTSDYAGVAARGPLDGSGRVRPIPGARLLVLDDTLALVGPGAAGDVYLGGAALAIELADTASDFGSDFSTDSIADPFRPVGRLARTGARGHWTADGWLVFDMAESIDAAVRSGAADLISLADVAPGTGDDLDYAAA